FIYAGGQRRVAQYYTPQGSEWTRWTAALVLDPVSVPRDHWAAYYRNQLDSGRYGVITLFYPTTFASAPGLPENLLLSPPGSRLNRELLRLVGQSSGEPGLPALTLALEADPEYRFVGAGQYNSAHVYSIYAIWQRVPS
ncbi:MAG TPA: hypothetical protein VEG33_04975, partial [Streptosporangiaceae bacterium]|nr:hypothetical protein [Streptosporangiaceae bacterium]